MIVDLGFFFRSFEYCRSELIVRDGNKKYSDPLYRYCQLVLCILDDLQLSRIIVEYIIILLPLIAAFLHVLFQ